MPAVQSVVEPVLSLPATVEPVRNQASHSTQPVASRRSTSYLPSLDGWRALAVLLVLFDHSIGRDTIPYADKLRSGFGVDIFFGISGLLICSRLLEEQNIRGRISLRDFYIRRFFRLMPAAWLFLAVVAVLSAAGILIVAPKAFVGCLLISANYYPRVGTWWYTVHFWSLAVEEHFYLLFPTLLILCGPRRLRWLLPVLALAVAAWRGVDTRYHFFESIGIQHGSIHRTDTRLDGLLWGCWVALLLYDYRTWLKHLLTFPIRLTLVCLMVASFFAPFPLLWSSFLIPWLLVGTVLHSEGIFGRFLESVPLRWLGRLSYSLYLWQQLFFVNESKNQVSFFWPFQQFPWNVPAVLVCASLSYYLLERPLTRLGHCLARPVSAGRV